MYMDTAKRVVPPYAVCLLIWVAKLETSHVLQSNKTKLTGVAEIAYQCQLGSFTPERSCPF